MMHAELVVWLMLLWWKFRLHFASKRGFCGLERNNSVALVVGNRSLHCSTKSESQNAKQAHSEIFMFFN